MKQLSPAMREALRYANNAPDGSLHRFPGGYWSTLGFRERYRAWEAAGKPLDARPWWTATGTVRALISRGVFEPTGSAGHPPFTITARALFYCCASPTCPGYGWKASERPHPCPS